MARAPRADAVRNRTRILDATREQITAHGPSVGMDQIAAAAGVAVGTLYRHFPTKADLVSAVLDEYMHRVADRADAAAERVRAGQDAATELLGFVTEVIDESAHNHAAKAAAATLTVTPTDDGAERSAATAIGTVLAKAKKDRTVRSDATVDDIYLLVASAPYDLGTEALRRWKQLVVPGLAGPVSTGKISHR